MKENIVVIYHGDCPDGFGGAYAAWKKFGAKAYYFAARDRLSIPEGLRGKTVYMIDWVYVPELTRQVKQVAKRVIAIDHHFTSAPAVKLADESLFELTHSGAALAWRYFHPDRKMPTLLRHIEDFDLWKFKLNGTREVDAMLYATGYDLRKWDRLIKDFETPTGKRKILEQGRVILKYQQNVVKEIAANAELVKFDGHTIYAVNSANYSSELGSMLCLKQPPFAIVWRRLKDGKLSVSLRSNGEYNVGELAEHFPNGGGHPASAGFTLRPGESIPWKPIHQ